MFVNPCMQEVLWTTFLVSIPCFTFFLLINIYECVDRKEEDFVVLKQARRQFIERGGCRVSNRMTPAGSDIERRRPKETDASRNFQHNKHLL